MLHLFPPRNSVSHCFLNVAKQSLHNIDIPLIVNHFALQANIAVLMIHTENKRVLYSHDIHNFRIYAKIYSYITASVQKQKPIRQPAAHRIIVYKKASIPMFGKRDT